MLSSVKGGNIEILIHNPINRYFSYCDLVRYGFRSNG
jgi:hypothetical protein